MQLMVEGDKWELYIPSELGYGDRGSPPKIGGGDALIFIMEMIEIMGDKVSAAVKCNVDTLEECSEKEKAYVGKAKGKYETKDAMLKEIERIHRVSEHVSESAHEWANARIAILLDLIAAKGGELEL